MSDTSPEPADEDATARLFGAGSASPVPAPGAAASRPEESGQPAESGRPGAEAAAEASDEHPGPATGPPETMEHGEAAVRTAGVPDERSEPATPAAGAAARGGGAAARGRGRRTFGLTPADSGPLPPRERRRRRLFGAGIAVAAAVIVAALCAGGFSVVAAVRGVRDRAADARQAQHRREGDCLDLETRLNRLPPPGSTSTPAARAAAIRGENAAVRIYLGQLRTQRDQDGWRQLIDARAVFADALDKQAQSRTPAFYVAPRAADGQAVTDELEQWSPRPCAGPIHRLAAPEL